MPALRSVGPVPVASNGVVVRSTVDNTLTGMATAADLQTKVDTAVAPYAQKTYVDSQDGNLLTKAQVDSADALRIPTSWKGAANGVCELSGTTVPSTRYSKGRTYPVIMSNYYHHTEFNAATTSSSAIVLDSTTSLPNNNAYYRILAFGNFEAWSPATVKSGKPYFAVYCNGVLIAYGGGREANSSEFSSPITVVPVGVDFALTPSTTSSRWNRSFQITVDIGVTGSGTITWKPETQTALTLYAIPAAGV